MEGKFVKLDEKYLTSKRGKENEIEDEKKNEKKKKADLLRDSWQSMLVLLEEIEREGEEWEPAEVPKVLEEDEEELEEEREENEARKRKKEIIPEEQERKKIRLKKDEIGGRHDADHHHHTGGEDVELGRNVVVEGSTTKKFVTASDSEIRIDIIQASSKVPSECELAELAKN